ncbi:hypothetical protein HMPREF9431_00734 [Segatella oulorum F0390]|uniref:Uncharacterized protein n=1 Tax=Segatella oulorum F0390 TaxID=702438 RepID=G1WA89_9BACT|nr:hypothetical protein [Segatella oulorum]EGV33498.1 hypothetical protein HMPREF9431_00734 [Segatella oulorum F0390]
MSNYVAARVVAVPVCRPARPTRAHPSLAVPSGLVETGCLRMAAHHSWVETCCLHVESCHFGMETPLHGRSGGHTGTAPTIWLEQNSKNKFETCLQFGKRRKKILRLAQGWANGKKIFWDLPKVGQTLKK